MLRKLGIGFIALATLAPGLSAALGVGEYQLNSYLNEPLNMTVELHDLGDLSKDQILAELASQEQFDAAGVERGYFLNDLEFQVIVEPGGDNGRLIITSEQPVREPYLDFLVEFLWPTGRLMREYTVLLDPPSYAESLAPVNPARSEAPPPASESPRPAPAQHAQPQRTRPESAPAPLSGTPERTPARPERPDEPARAASTPASPTSAPQTYRVRASDTLWRIAERTRPDPDVSVQQMMMAIQEHNPDAFIDGNVNLVREGAVLRLPEQDQARGLSNREALARVATQNREWQRLREQRGTLPEAAPLDATGREISPRNGDGAEGGRVTLVTPDSTEGVADGDGTGSASGGAANTAALQNELAIRDENLDRLRRENDELRSRVGDLGDQVETSQRLLELRNERISALQDELRRLSEEQGADIDPQWLEQPALAGDGDDVDAADVGIIDSGDAGRTDSAVADGDDLGAGDTDSATGDDSATVGANSDSGRDVAATPGASAEDGAARVAATRPRADSGGFVDDLIGRVMDNLLYIGAGLLVLLLLLLLAVRRRRDGGGEADSALPPEGDDGFDDMPLMADQNDDQPQSQTALEEDLEDDTMDPMERADVYVAYGQYPQAVDYLRNEINLAPQRADLKIRLLELLREMDDDSGFQQQVAMLAGTGAAVDAAIKRLGGDPGDQDYTAIADDPAEYDEAEEELSLDDLELDLASDLSGSDADDSTLGGASYGVAPVAADDQDGDQAEDGDDNDLVLGDFDFRLNEDDGEESSAADSNHSLDGSLEFDQAEPARSGDNESFEFTLDDDEQNGDLPFTGDELAMLDDNGEGVENAESAGEDFGDLQLDDGDASLSGDVSLEEEESSDDIDDLDLALDDLSLDDLDLGDEAATVDTAASDEDDPAAPAIEESAPRTTPEPEPEPSPAPITADVKNDDVLGDDDDFDFLSETDENATKLDLARAYIDMGDTEGARDILNEVLGEGNEEQQSEAKELLARVG